MITNGERGRLLDAHTWLVPERRCPTSAFAQLPRIASSRGITSARQGAGVALGRVDPGDRDGGDRADLRCDRPGHPVLGDPDRPAGRAVALRDDGAVRAGAAAVHDAARVVRRRRADRVGRHRPRPHPRLRGAWDVLADPRGTPVPAQHRDGPDLPGDRRGEPALASRGGRRGVRPADPFRAGHLRGAAGRHAVLAVLRSRLHR